ncbi:MAG: DUF6618 family protein [Caulobacteraceae bacterium]
MRRGKSIEEWPATITKLINHGSHYEMQISSRSSITVIFGDTLRGGFCCIPGDNAGCELAGYNDLFWNLERITAAMKNKVDAVTVAFAIAAVGKLLDENGQLSKAL